MFNFKNHLELINYHAPSHTFESKDYEELIDDIGKTYGFNVIGSNIKTLGLLSNLYVFDGSKRIAFLNTNVDDFKVAARHLSSVAPMPLKSHKVHIPQENSRHLKDIIRAVELEIDQREKLKRMPKVPDKFKTTCELDEDGRVMPNSQIRSSTKIVDGLLAGDIDASALFQSLMILAPARTEII